MSSIRLATLDGRRLPSRARPVTATSTERSVTVKLAPDLHDAFEALAHSQGMTKSGLARRLVEREVDRMGRS